MFGATLAQITAEACVPEQLVHYVRAVSGRRVFLCEGYAAYPHEGHAVLAAYPDESQADEYERLAPGFAPAGQGGLREGETLSLETALRRLSADYASVTVLSPLLPAEAPAQAAKEARYDCYWQLPLPVPRPGVKLRNMLARAGRELGLHEEKWQGEHQALVDHYLATRPLPPGTRSIFSSLHAYVNGLEGNVSLFAARRADGRLAGFAVGDFSGLCTAFYMFAFRYPDAPPGTADLLLSGLARRGEELGHSRLNLGLGISAGISFFKKKWGALPYLPYVETSWRFRSGTASGIKGVFRKLFG